MPHTDAMDPFACQRCAASGPTCCQLAPGQEEFCFPLSVLEKERIRDVFPDQGAFAVSENSSAFVDNLYRLFPRERERIRELFPERKTHLRLAVDAGGRCRLLGPAGCTLPREARPYYCRIFPLWMTAGNPALFASSGCLAVREARTIPRLMHSLDLTPARLRDLHSRLRLAWGLPPQEGMPQVGQSLARSSK